MGSPRGDEIMSQSLCGFRGWVGFQQLLWAISPTDGLKQQKFVLSVLEARSLKSRCQQGYALSSCCGCWHFLACDCITLIWALLLCVALLLLTLTRTLVIGFRTHVDNPG